MPVCPAGTRIKPAIVEDEFWLTIGDALQQLEDLEFIASDVTQFLGSILNIVVPSRIDLNELCATEPDPVPAIDFAALILSGEWRRASTSWPAWVIAAWKRNYWNTYCECIPGVGPGACPPIAKFGTPITNSTADAMLKGQEVSIPHGFDGLNITYRIDGATVTGLWYIGHELYDAAHAPIAPSATYYREAIAQATNVTVGKGGLYTTAQKSAARSIAVWAKPAGTGTIVNGVAYTYTPTLAITFTGTCADIEGTPAPGPALPPPLVIDTPLPVLGPEECTINTVCSMLQALTIRVEHLLLNQSEHILLDVNTNDHVHSHLPVVIPPDGGDGGGDGGGIPGNLEYTKGETFGPLIDESSVAIEDLVGVQVGVSARPAGGLELEGQPRYLWNMGWVSILNVDGMLAERRITREGMVWLPREMPLATSLTWTLREGVEVYITELLPVTA